jgi:hypothetical protein
MKCRDIQKKLSAYLEGIVSSKEKEGVENHLSSCQTCRKAFEELKRTDALVKGLEQVEPPPWFTQKIMSRVRAEQESKKNIIQRLFYPLHIKVPIEAFATVLIAVAAVYLFKANEPEMKRIHVPAATEQSALKDEASKQPAETKGDTTILEGKVALEGVPKPQKQKGATRDKDQREKEVKEELRQRTAPPPAAEAPLPPVLAMKKEVPPPPTQTSKPSNQHAQAYRQSPAPAGAEQEADSAARAPARGEKVDRRASSAAPPITALSVTKPGAIEVTLQTRDAKASSRDVENILNQLGAQNIKKESLQGTEILTAELQAEKTQELLEKLKLLGEVKEKGLPPEHAKQTIKIRIETTSSP